MHSIFAQSGTWYNRALCFDRTDLDIAFSATNSITALPAKQLCAQCTVVNSCLGEAMAFERLQLGVSSSFRRNGVRGGLLPRERKAAEKTYVTEGLPAFFEYVVSRRIKLE